MRAGFQAMLAAIEAGDFPDILFAKDDKRLFRNEREAGTAHRMDLGAGCRNPLLPDGLWRSASE